MGGERQSQTLKKKVRVKETEEAFEEEIAENFPKLIKPINTQL